ncbi:MAG: aminotransferase class V-fold PLP-dependent enzyme [Acidobacteria bacterium]|nr:aminotransferase class V-fold PLP-dependent enzyme [Acidobacteriota bacterium]MBI3658706.1 aminotransferase class V-fold PLP-dependent enzyme [Acidobacteriota bacterium]
MIDLRSDTVTKPTPEMRQAMAEAEVGDDVYLEDPTVNRLEARAAELFGHEAALFVPTGTMGNQIAIKCHTHAGQEVIVESEGHIYSFEMAAMAAISGVMPRLIPTEDGILHWRLVRAAVQPKTYYRAQTGLVTLENTHNMAGGTVYPLEVIDEICEKAHAAGLPVHMDGARIFNAAAALRRTVAEITRHVDSVMFCLSKGLCAPVGSLLVGKRNFIEQARIVRKRLGGGMRQVGVLAAAGLIALEKMTGRLVEDHENAKILALKLAELPGLAVPTEKVQTNIVMCRLTRTAWSATELAGALKERGVLVGALSEDRVRLVTHHDVNDEQIQLAVEIIQSVWRERWAE